MNLPPLTKSTTFLGGFKTVLNVPKMSDDDEGSISGKQSGVDDGQLRGSASLASISLSLIVCITSLIFAVNH